MRYYTYRVLIHSPLLSRNFFVATGKCFLPPLGNGQEICDIFFVASLCLLSVFNTHTLSLRSESEAHCKQLGVFSFKVLTLNNKRFLRFLSALPLKSSIPK